MTSRDKKVTSHDKIKTVIGSPGSSDRVVGGLEAAGRRAGQRAVPTGGQRKGGGGSGRRGGRRLDGLGRSESGKDR